MSLFDFLMLVGGLALFLYGMDLMGDGLKNVSGGKLKGILERLTSSPVKGVLLGAGVTGIIQSSSATTVMVVGFVNSGIMQLEKTVGVIMGANIGTTVTAWLLSLTGIEGDNILVRLLNPTSFSPILALIGVIFIMFLNDEKKRDIGTIMVGFAIIMFGMENMSNAVAPLKDVPEFRDLMIKFSNPLYGLLAGTVLTAIIQSSSASVGILQALCATGAIPYSVALPIIMGQNIGTCITAILASIGTSRNSKRTACIHLSFNLIGTTVLMSGFYILNFIFHFSFVDMAASEVGIAIIHSVFNITTTLMLLPFSKKLVTLARKILPDKGQEEKKSAVLSLLEPRFLDEPSYAIAQAKKVSEYIANETTNIFTQSKPLLHKYDKVMLQSLEQQENALKDYYQNLDKYLMQIAGKPLLESDSYMLDVLLQSIGDFERISKHTIEIARKSKDIKKQETPFSKQAQQELEHTMEEIELMLKLTSRILSTEKSEVDEMMQTQKNAVEELLAKCKKHHIKRLRKGKCTAESGVQYMDVLYHCGSIAEHCANVSKSFVS